MIPPRRQQVGPSPIRSAALRADRPTCRARLVIEREGAFDEDRHVEGGIEFDCGDDVQWLGSAIFQLGLILTAEAPQLWSMSDPEALADIREADATYVKGDVVRGADAVQDLLR